MTPTEDRLRELHDLVSRAMTALHDASARDDFTEHDLELVNVVNDLLTRTWRNAARRMRRERDSARDELARLRADRERLRFVLSSFKHAIPDTATCQCACSRCELIRAIESVIESVIGREALSEPTPGGLS